MDFPGKGGAIFVTFTTEETELFTTDYTDWLKITKKNLCKSAQSVVQKIRCETLCTLW